mmetsp:Transcript_28310/g.50147  ORF Transcript_28310/g.50147 Transcript_28310/m.50147 type:complete len:163 (-) Transcript_28310:86-574(-)
MAHGVHVSDKDLNLMKQQGSAVAHCPLSNFFFAGGSLPCKHLLERGNKVGLGTDIAGGYHPSIVDSARAAVLASMSLKHQYQDESLLLEKPRATTLDDDPPLDYRHSFYLATLGGADALGMADTIGSLRVGMEFDAFVLSTNGTLPDVFPSDTLADCFQNSG